MHLFFSTPVWASKINNYKVTNDEINKYITDLQKRDPSGITRSNLKGWHSKDFDLRDQAPKKFLDSIKEDINIALKDMNWDLKKQFVKIPNLWAIVNEHGAMNQKHQHSNSDLSAAYYVSAENNCGDILFYDPRPARMYKHPISMSPNNLNSAVNSIKPEPGLLVLFPSYLEHSVNANLSNNKRIVVSFNIILEKK